MPLINTFNTIILVKKYRSSLHTFSARDIYICPNPLFCRNGARHKMVERG